MYEFEYVRPASIDEAVKALADEDAQALAGGQTLIPTLKQRLAQPTRLVDLRGCLGREVKATGDGGCEVGGAATHMTVATSKDSPEWLRHVAWHIGDAQVRNCGTIGGSLANNDPAACYPAAVLASGATVKTNKREIAADDYFRGLFETALEEGEIITSVVFPKVEAANYQKFEQPASHFPLVGVCVAKTGAGVRVAVTGASESGVFRWAEAEQALSSNFSPDAVKDLSVPPDGMMGDLHGTPEYRAHLVGVLTGRAVAAAA